MTLKRSRKATRTPFTLLQRLAHIQADRDAIRLGDQEVDTFAVPQVTYQLETVDLPPRDPRKNGQASLVLRIQVSPMTLLLVVPL